MTNYKETQIWYLSDSLINSILNIDSDLNINWQVDHKDIKLSPKDDVLLSFKDAENNFKYGN